MTAMTQQVNLLIDELRPQRAMLICDSGVDCGRNVFAALC